MLLERIKLDFPDPLIDFQELKKELKKNRLRALEYKESEIKRAFVLAGIDVTDLEDIKKNCVVHIYPTLKERYFYKGKEVLIYP